jgi:hypothetical protein
VDPETRRLRSGLRAASRQVAKRLRESVRQGDGAAPAPALAIRALALSLLGEEDTLPPGDVDLPRSLAECRARPELQPLLRFLDPVPLSTDEASVGTLTPASLEHLLESSVDREGHGAFYTASDVTGYICRFTLLPRLLDALGDPVADQLISRNEDPQPYLLERIETRATAEALHGFYFGCIRRLTVLDPTCGAGAFLVAALHALVPIHSACLARMASLVGAPHTPEALSRTFTQELAKAAAAGSSDAYAARNVIEKSLRGLELMPEAVEVTRLRLYLALRHRAGAAACPSIGETRFGVGTGSALAPGAAAEADVVIGNPPYVQTAAFRKAHGAAGTEGEEYGNVFGYFVERALDRLRPGGTFGMVLPVSAISGRQYAPLMDRLRPHSLWISSYSNRPASLFEGVEQRLAIVLARLNRQPALHVTRHHHWRSDERPRLFQDLRYVPGSWSRRRMPAKTGSAMAESVFRKLAAHGGVLPWGGSGEHAVYLHDGPTYWVRALPFDPTSGLPPARRGHYHRIPVASREDALVLAAVLSSTTFYCYFKATSNCRDLSQEDWRGFPIDPLPDELRTALVSLGCDLEQVLLRTRQRRTRRYPSGFVEYYEYYPARAKCTLDRIDRVLARHYGFTEEETRFLVEYDIKYRIAEK